MQVVYLQREDYLNAGNSEAVAQKQAERFALEQIRANKEKLLKRVED
ncbi:MAG: hypothetical protein HC879_20575 [Leptolyngbyaceae cyanobacterium SL_5_9]|nr:hypothetical protein [Leptolyngbyaceae cyanobacterium SL_5_9]NJO75068.1 hypothetical protein [Leptolyngbyaceae cyanobacterium RM1_406_9]